jgi:membrane fusion protein, multidrug efflux system
LPSSERPIVGGHTGTPPEGTVAHANADPMDHANAATAYAAGTGRQLRFAAIAIAVILAIAFFVTFLVKLHAAHSLARDTSAWVGAPALVDVVTVRNEAQGRPLTLPGETAAWYESLIYPRVSGYVGTWAADIGDHVETGEILATIETPELDADYLAAKAKLTAAEAQVKVREAGAAFAASTYVRWRDSPKGVVSEQEREDKKAGEASSAAELDSARAQVKLAQADVERLAAFEKFKNVTAPYAGTITERRIDIGNLVAAGSSATSTPLYRMAQDYPLRVFVNVPQSAAVDLMKAGVPVQITMNGLTQPIPAQITRTSAAIDPQARTFRVEIDIAKPSAALVPGMYVDVAFLLNNSGMLQVPAAALVFRSGHPQVAVVDATGNVHLRDVAIGRDDGNTIELQSGVSSGERLVLNLSNQIADGQPVRISADSAARTLAAAQIPSARGAQ